MKRFLAIALVASVGLFAGSAMAGTFEKGLGGAYAHGDAANGIGNSRHNLGAFGEHVTAKEEGGTIAVSASGKLMGTTEICVFCHTPHHANTSTKPLWNRSTAASTSYTAYGTTIAGTDNTTLSAGSVSLACLSCHDGVTAFDALVNAPGKSGVNASISATTGLGWTLTEYTKNLSTSSRLRIGESLVNDHPVNIDYRGASGNELVASLRPISTTIGTLNLSADLNDTTTYFDDITSNLWAVKGFLNSTATIQDLLRSNTVNGIPTAGTGKVECSSCHDPHFKNQSAEEVFFSYSSDSGDWDVEVDGLFLRRVGGNTGSGLCRTCHEK